MNIKYTKDNKKVMVHEVLNANQSVVQEIFIVDGKEVPLCEKFVVTDLRDEYTLSWREREIKNRECDYEKSKQEYSELSEKLKKEYSKLYKMFRYFSDLNKKFDTDVFTDLENYLSGKIAYVITNDYGCIKVSSFINALTQSDREDRGDLRLLSLYGNSQGDMKFRINRYSDGSGSNSEVMYAMDDYDLSVKLKSLVEANPSVENMKLAKRYRININPDIINDMRLKISKGYEAKCTSLLKEEAKNKANYLRDLEEINSI